MTDWIFKSLLGSKIRPQRRGMEQGYFQSLDGMQLFHRECWQFFLGVEVFKSYLRRFKPTQCRVSRHFVVYSYFLHPICPSAVDHLLPENSGKLVFLALGLFNLHFTRSFHIRSQGTISPLFCY